MAKAKVQYKIISMDKLVVCDWNYKKFDDVFMMKQLVANIKKNGQVENLIVCELEKGYFSIINGNHRFLAMKELGIKKAMCCNLGKISEAKAKRIAVETNETGFKADDEKLAALLGEIVIEEEDFSETNPFTEEEMKNFNSIVLDDEEEVTQSSKKTTKTKTVTSMAGQTYTTLKIEARPETAEEFTELIHRFAGDKSSEDTSLSVICKFMSKYSDKEIFGTAGVKTPKAQQKKQLKSSAVM